MNKRVFYALWAIIIIIIARFTGDNQPQMADVIAPSMMPSAERAASIVYGVIAGPGLPPTPTPVDVVVGVVTRTVQCVRVSHGNLCQD